MAILFYNDIQKANGDIPRLLMENAALWRLRRFMDKDEPKLVYWLVTLWKHQGDAITYKELREWILNGEIDQKAIEDWQQDYSRFVKKYLEPIYIQGMEEANAELKERFPELFVNFTDEQVQAFAMNQSAKFVTNSTMEQILAVRTVVERAQGIRDIPVDTLARVIRPMVGLDIKQTRANMNYFENCINHGMSDKRALDASFRYASRQHRYRAYRIARTETAFAYNHGQDEGIRMAQQKGYMGKTVKQWVTADDERTCDICGGLDGKIIEMDETFGFKTRLPRSYQMLPPAHPHCRCVVIYLETEPPKYGPEFNVSGVAAQ